MKHIMIVDDSATSRMFVKRCLEIVFNEKNESEYSEAGNGKEALAKLKGNPADLVLLDLNMPIMDGATFLRWLRSSPKTNHIPVVVITSVDNDANREALVNLGATQVLSKPVAPAKLMPVLNEIFELETDGFGY